MAMGALSQVVAPPGVAVNMQTPSGTETILATDDLAMDVSNASGASITVTFTDNSLTAAGSVSVNPVVTVTAGQRKRIFVSPLFAAPTGLITATFSATASVTAEWFRV